MEVLSLDLLFAASFRAIEGSQLGDVVKDLGTVVFHVLYWVEAEV
jgi:hypothetical protein